ncbi:MAG: helix-turn-helix domain-containing protein [Thermoplasmata archaeon]
MLSRLDLGRTQSLTEIRLRCTETDLWANELRGLPQVDKVEELEGGPTEVHLRVIHRTSEFIPIFRDLQLMRRFPFTIQGGEATWIVVAPKLLIRRLLARIQERALGASLESIRRASSVGPSGTLTPRRAELLRKAMAAGYFDVPRKVTLTDLAKRLGLAPSSLSEALAIGEKKLLEEWPGVETA